MVNYATIEKVVLEENVTSIAYLQDTEGKQYKSDFFVDCTGFKSLLSESLENTFHSFGDCNDLLRTVK